MTTSDRPGRTASALLADAEQTEWHVETPWPTGFSTLDRTLGGGLHAGELTLLGGAQGLGKTTLALQIARSVARNGGHAVYLCYEHTDRQLFERLITMEAGLQSAFGDPITLDDVRMGLAAYRAGEADVTHANSAVSDALAAVRRVQQYGERLRFVRGRGSHTALDEVAEIVSSAAEERAAVFVDYLQKVPVTGTDLLEDERVTRVVERLKDLALEHGVPVLAIVAADKSGLDGSRTRIQDLRGSTALAYEADVALLLNDKYQIVARHHLMYGTPDAGRFHEYVVCSIEKNRSGRAGIDIELHKAFERGCFDESDGLVLEQLRDERIHIE